LKSPPFEYARAASIEAACELLSQHGDAAKIIAGGQSLVPMMAFRLLRPSWLIDINEIAALKFVAFEADAVRMGAYFIGGIVASLLALAAVAWVLLRSLKAFLRSAGAAKLPANLRHGMANLYRPGNQAQTVLVALGLGVMFSLTIYLVQHSMLADIARSQAELAAGESYEVCLTDQISTDASPDPFDLYRNLRRSNPAPFASYLKLGEVAVVSSSPERFLSVDRERRVEARPIKGTTSRSADPAQDAALKAELTDDEKTYAEHLMIVDLLRNDLGIVCEVGSVAVPELMVVEDYATVHQLISTVEGTLPANRSAVECAHACFPGGSMTGAPKLRTMEIIDDIEAEARGVYSGAIGYFGLDGVMDLSIVIRTIVIRPGRTTIGAGGAIVMQSDPEEEFEEILLKARAPMFCSPMEFSIPAEVSNSRGGGLPTIGSRDSPLVTKPPSFSSVTMSSNSMP